MTIDLQWLATSTLLRQLVLLLLWSFVMHLECEEQKDDTRMLAEKDVEEACTHAIPTVSHV